MTRVPRGRKPIFNWRRRYWRMRRNDPRRALGKGINSLLPSRSAPVQELAQSIESDGIIQPLLVRKTGPNQHQIIAGERRWRAAKMAGLKEVPVIVREANDEKVLALAIIENIQREDLNPIDLAMAFQRMAIELGLNHDQIGQKTGK